MIITNAEFQKTFQDFVQNYGDTLIPVLKRMKNK